MENFSIVESNLPSKLKTDIKTTAFKILYWPCELNFNELINNKDCFILDLQHLSKNSSFICKQKIPVNVLNKIKNLIQKYAQNTTQKTSS